MQPIRFCYFTGSTSTCPMMPHEPSSISQHALELLARHRESSTSPAQPATSSLPAANPCRSPSGRPTQSCLVSAPRSLLNVRKTRGRGGPARRASEAEGDPRLRANVLQLLWLMVDGPGSRYRAPAAMWSSLRARLRAAQRGLWHPTS